MASLAYLSLTFYFLLTFSLLPIHARDLNTFNKVMNNELSYDTTANAQETSVSAIGRAQPENLPSQSQNGYGLYGRGPDEYFPTNEGSRFAGTQFGTEIPDSRETNAFYPQYESPKNTEKYGMSDTRVVENGKYFYDLNNQRHGEAYNPLRANSEGYGAKDNGKFGYGVYNYEGRDKSYDYKREMEGRQNNQNQNANQDAYYDP